MYLYLRLWVDRTSSYRNLPGPPRGSLLFGNASQVAGKLDDTNYQPAWHAQYGERLRFRLLLNTQVLLTRDPAALAFMMANGDIFHKPPKVDGPCPSLMEIDSSQLKLSTPASAAHSTPHSTSRRSETSFQFSGIMPICS
jgi:hypothetical protein